MAQWPDSSTFLNDYDGCEDEKFFQCGAVELAQKLLGQYLYCHQSEIVVRILETEAYPEDEFAVYQTMFLNHKNPELHAKFKIKGGTTVAWKPIEGGTCTSTWNLYITAGTEDTGDVVKLRSCDPIEGRHIIEKRRQINHETNSTTKKLVLIGPTKIPQGLGNEWESNPVLYEEGGVQLFYGTVPPEEKVLCGERYNYRILSKTSKELSYRFALETKKPSYAYYANKKTLKPLQQ